MHQFKDNENRTWRVSINVTTIKLVRAEAGIDIPALIDDKCHGLNELLKDAVKLVEVLATLCQEQFAKANPACTPENFGAAMAGDALSNAADAFLEELSDFFPDRRVRKALKDVIAKSKRVMDRVLEAGEKEIDAVGDKEIEAMAAMLIADLKKRSQESGVRSQESGDRNQEMQRTTDNGPRTYSSSVTSLPASPASTPAPSLSAS